MKLTDLQHYWHHLFDNHDLNYFFVSISIRWFGVAFLGIFITGYLWTLNYSFSLIALFFAIIAFTHAFTVPLAGKMVEKKGVKFSIFCSTPLATTFFLSLFLLKNHYLLFLPIAMLGGFSHSTFWVSYHLIFSQKADNKTRGEKMSALVFLSGLLMIVAPVIGGLLIDKLGFFWVALITTIFMFLSFIPLIKIPETRIPKNWTTKSIIFELKSKKGAGYFACGLIGPGINVVWPLFLFIILDGFVILGLVYFLTGLFSLLMNLFAGWLNDYYGHKRMLKYSGFAESLLWVARLFSIVPMVAIIIDALDKTVIRFFSLSFDARSYELTNGSHAERILSREIGLNVGAGVALLVIFFLPYFGIAFTLSAIGALWSMLL